MLNCGQQVLLIWRGQSSTLLPLAAHCLTEEGGACRIGEMELLAEALRRRASQTFADARKVLHACKKYNLPDTGKVNQARNDCALPHGVL